MSDGAVQTEAVTILDTLMIVRITRAIHTRASPTPMRMRPSSPLRGPFAFRFGSGSQRGRLLASAEAQRQPAQPFDRESLTQR